MAFDDSIQPDGGGPTETPVRGAGLRRAGRRLVAAAAVSMGMLCGLGAFTFVYGNGVAYMGSDPASCANCHVMQSHYDSWLQSSHKNVATCNDCHLPHHPIGKWVTKSDNGFFHSLAFTTGGFDEPIRIKPRNRRVTQSACIDCHGEYVANLLSYPDADQVPLCAGCHSDVGHAMR